MPRPDETLIALTPADRGVVDRLWGIILIKRATGNTADDVVLIKDDGSTSVSDATLTLEVETGAGAYPKELRLPLKRVQETGTTYTPQILGIVAADSKGVLDNRPPRLQRLTSIGDGTFSVKRNAADGTRVVGWAAVDPDDDTPTLNGVGTFDGSTFEAYTGSDYFGPSEQLRFARVQSSQTHQGEIQYTRVPNALDGTVHEFPRGGTQVRLPIAMSDDFSSDVGRSVEYVTIFLLPSDDHTIGADGVSYTPITSAEGVTPETTGTAVSDTMADSDNLFDIEVPLASNARGRLHVATTDKFSTVKWQGAGAPEGDIVVAVGDDEVYQTFWIEAEDGSRSELYRVRLELAMPEFTRFIWTSGTQQPAFATGVYVYTSRIPSGTPRETITYEDTDTESVVSVSTSADGEFADILRSGTWVVSFTNAPTRVIRFRITRHGVTTTYMVTFTVSPPRLTLASAPGYVVQDADAFHYETIIPSGSSSATLTLTKGADNRGNHTLEQKGLDEAVNQYSQLVDVNGVFTINETGLTVGTKSINLRYSDVITGQDTIYRWDFTVRPPRLHAVSITNSATAFTFASDTFTYNLTSTAAAANMVLTVRRQNANQTMSYTIDGGDRVTPTPTADGDITITVPFNSARVAAETKQLLIRIEANSVRQQYTFNLTGAV